MIIDDQSIFRLGLMAALQKPMPEACMVEAASIEEALLHGDAVDLVLLECAGYLSSLLSAIGQLKAAWPTCRLILISACNQVEGDAIATQVGADHFLSKSLPCDHIISAILLQLDHIKGTAPALPKMTQRQGEILALMSRGLTNKMIARALNISEHTVRWHVQTILALLEASCRSEAIFFGRNLGLIH